MLCFCILDVKCFIFLLCLCHVHRMAQISGWIFLLRLGMQLVPGFAHNTSSRCCCCCWLRSLHAPCPDTNRARGLTCATMNGREWLRKGARVDAYMSDIGWQPAYVQSLDTNFGTATLVVNGTTLVDCNVFNSEEAIAKAGTHVRHHSGSRAHRSHGRSHGRSHHEPYAHARAHDPYATAAYTSPAAHPYATHTPVSVDPEVAAAAAAAGISVTGEDVAEPRAAPSKKKKGGWLSSIKSTVGKMMPSKKKKSGSPNSTPSSASGAESGAGAGGSAAPVAAAAPTYAAATATSSAIATPAPGGAGAGNMGSATAATTPHSQPVMATPVVSASGTAEGVVAATPIAAGDDSGGAPVVAAVASDDNGAAVYATPVTAAVPSGTPVPYYPTPPPSYAHAQSQVGPTTAELNGLGVGTIHDVKDLFPHKRTGVPMYHWRPGRVRLVQPGRVLVRGFVVVCSGGPRKLRPVLPKRVSTRSDGLGIRCGSLKSLTLGSMSMSGRIDLPACACGTVSLDLPVPPLLSRCVRADVLCDPGTPIPQTPSRTVSFHPKKCAHAPVLEERSCFETLWATTSAWFCLYLCASLSLLLCGCQRWCPSSSLCEQLLSFGVVSYVDFQARNGQWVIGRIIDVEGDTGKVWVINEVDPSAVKELVALDSGRLARQGVMSDPSASEMKRKEAESFFVAALQSRFVLVWVRACGVGQCGRVPCCCALAQRCVCVRCSGMGLRHISPDGNCLFRSIAHQLYGDPDRFREVRHDICEYLADNNRQFEPSFQSIEANDATFDDYVARMRTPGQWGGAVELLAAEEVYDRCVLALSPVRCMCCRLGHGRGFDLCHVADTPRIPPRGSWNCLTRALTDLWWSMHAKRTL